MANLLDEVNGPVLQDGQDINVIGKRLDAKVGWGSTLFEFLLWFPLLLPGLIFLFKKIKARNFFMRLEQQMQRAASKVDTYLEHRVEMLKNVAVLVRQQLKHEKDVFEGVAALRGGVKTGQISEETRNDIQAQVDRGFSQINLAFEAYPELKSNQVIESAMRDNTNTQREITASRIYYNDIVDQWNRNLFVWPTKQIVAAKMGLTTRIPFAASKEVKAAARQTFF